MNENITPCVPLLFCNKKQLCADDYKFQNRETTCTGDEDNGVPEYRYRNGILQREESCKYFSNSEAKDSTTTKFYPTGSTRGNYDRDDCIYWMNRVGLKSFKMFDNSRPILNRMNDEILGSSEADELHNDGIRLPDSTYSNEDYKEWTQEFLEDKFSNYDRDV